MTKCIHVSRHSTTKRFANMMSVWMNRFRMKQVKVQGVRGKWEVTAVCTTLQLAQFTAREAKYISKDRSNWGWGPDWE